MAKPLVPDALWAKVEPLLPPVRVAGTRGQPPVPNRACRTGIPFVLKTGIAWADLPAAVARLRRGGGRWAGRACLRAACWCWCHRPYHASAAAFLAAAWTVYLVFDATVVLATSTDGGSRGGARTALVHAGVMLLLIAVLWLVSRTRPLPARLARTSFAIATVWWAYVAYRTSRPEPPWYW